LLRLGVALLAMAGVLAVLWFAVTSETFLKAVVLPRAGAALGVRVTVQDASVSPFSRVELRGLKVETTRSEPILDVAEVRVRSNLRQVLKGNIVVDEALFVEPVLTLSQAADGRSNLDDLMKSLASGADRRDSSATPPRLNVASVKIENGRIRASRRAAGEEASATVSGLNVTATSIANGSQIPILVTATVEASRSAATNRAALKGSLSADLRLALSSALQPDAAAGFVALTVSEAKGDVGGVSGVSATLGVDCAAKEIRRLALQFTRGPASAAVPVGRIEASGPFDFASLEGRLSVNVSSVDRHALNLAGAAAGLDFGTTVFNSTNVVTFAKSARSLAVRGAFSADSLSVARGGGTRTPRLDARAAYDLELDLAAGSSRVTALGLDVRHEGRELVHASLSKPMLFWWATNAIASAGDTTVDLRVTDLDLADWRLLAGRVAPSGVVTLSARVNASQSGALLDAVLHASADALALRTGTNMATHLGGTARARVRLDDFKRVRVEEFRLDATQDRDWLGTAQCSGTFDAASGNAGAEGEVRVLLPRAVALAGLAEPKAVTGIASFAGRIGQQVTVTNFRPSATQSVAGRLALTGFNGSLGGAALTAATATVDVDGEFRAGRELVVRTLAGGLAVGGEPAGSFDANGTFDLETRAGRASLKLVEVNQNLAQPLLARTSGDVALLSGALSLDATAALDAKAGSTVAGRLRLDRVLARDRAGRLPDAPFALVADVDAALRAPATNALFVDVRRLDVSATAGRQPAGSLALHGWFDRQKQQARAGIKLTEVNQRLLGPLLAPALGGKALVTASLNASANAGFDARADSTLTGDFSVSNFRVRDPARALPGEPLALQFSLEAAMKDRRAELRQFALNLTPTMKARNHVTASGRADFSNTNATQFALNLKADALDLTGLADVLDGSPPATASARAAKPSFFSSNPAPLRWPVRSSRVEVGIRELHWRELAARDVTATATLDGGRVALEPLRFSLNGAPVNASAALDCGVSGWRYQFALLTGRVPVQALADALSPAYRGQARGELLADIALTGEGVTGASLRSNLAGHATVTFTNAAIHLVGPGVRKLWMPVAVFLGLDELYKSPVNLVTADIKAGDGGLFIRKLAMQGPAFIAETSGTIPFADALADSPISQPVEIHLANALARKFSLLAAVENQPYAKLPTFVSLHGTLGEPKTEVDRLRATFVGASGAVGLVPGRAGEVVRGAAEKAAEAAKGTARVIEGVGKGIGFIFGGKSATNAPAKK
jgi:hypothetical protein